MGGHAAARTPYEALADYERRSLAHVAGRPEQNEPPGHWRGVGFRLGSRRLLAPFEDVVEIVPLPAITPVPGAAPWMRGIANVRGNLLPVVDLKQFLEGERTALLESPRMLVVRQSGGDVAVLIDELFGQRSFNDAQRAEPGDLQAGRYADFVDLAYCAGGVTWGVFSMELLTRTPEFRHAAA